MGAHAGDLDRHCALRRQRLFFVRIILNFARAAGAADIAVTPVGF
jgi:hypothetical protein